MVVTNFKKSIEAILRERQLISSNDSNLLLFNNTSEHKTGNYIWNQVFVKYLILDIKINHLDNIRNSTDD